MQYEKELIVVSQGLKSETTMNVDSKPADSSTWEATFKESRRPIALLLWAALLLLAPFLLFNGILAENQTVLLSWIVLLFIAPFFVFFGLLHARHIRLLLMSTLLLAAPFFILNGLLHAHDMMTKGSAGITQTEIPLDQLRVLWLSLVLGDTLSFIALAISTLMIFKYLCSEQQTGFVRHVLRELGQLGRSLWFWLFVIVQVIVFVMINSPDGRFKIGGMLMFVCSVLLLLASQDRNAPAGGKRLRSLGWTGWLSLVLVIVSFPILFILLNGFADYLLLMLSDKAAAKLVDLFEPGSPMLGFTAITAAKFVSQWLNLWPMTLILCAGLTIRGVSPNS